MQPYSQSAWRGNISQGIANSKPSWTMRRRMMVNQYRLFVNENEAVPVLAVALADLRETT